MPENGMELAADTGPSSSNSNGQTTRDGGRIVQLSEIIVTEMRASGVPRRPAPQIYRVPKERLAADKGAYQPRFLPLGPYHRGDSESATEEMRRSDEGKPENLAFAILGGGPPVVEYMEAIASLESEARICYGRDVTMGWDAFCRMLLLDAFQLITLLGYLGRYDDVEDEPPPADDNDSNSISAGGREAGCNPKTSVQLANIGHDLMLLENQIPFFVVQKMYSLRHGDDGGAIAELAWRTIRNIMSGVPAASSHPPAECQHLVHLCHAYLKPSNLLAEPLGSGACGGEYGRFRRAAEYYEAGVKFRPLHKEQDDPLLDVSFSNGVLRMARHRVDEKINYILRNVLVYEQRTATGRDTGYVTAYVVFMSQLLASPEDVALLSRRGVLEHHLVNDDEVCALYRSLAQELVFDSSSAHYLNAVGVKLRAYYGSRLNRWGAWIINPWLAAAWVFGAAAVLGTIIQTVALLQYVNQPQHQLASYKIYGHKLSKQ